MLKKITILVAIGLLAAFFGPEISPALAKGKVSEKTPLIEVEKDKIWVALPQALEMLEAKVDVQEGQKVLCRNDLCILLPSERIKISQGQKFLDYNWASKVIGPQQSKKTSRPIPGKAAPHFELPNLSGKTIHLDSLKGQKTIVYVWGSW